MRQIKFCGTFAARQGYGKNAEVMLARVALDGQAHFLVVPWTEAMRTKENHADVALAERFFNGGLPGITRKQIPLIEPTGQAPLLQFLSKFFDQRRVSAIVG